MPWYISIYVALLLMSLPFGVRLLRQLEQDWLHPVGSVLSTLMSALFVVIYWLPDLLVSDGAGVLVLYVFVLAWDCYLMIRMRQRLPEIMALMGMPDEDVDDGVFLMGFLLMVPAYLFGALVCLRALA